MTFTTSTNWPLKTTATFSFQILQRLLVLALESLRTLEEQLLKPLGSRDVRVSAWKQNPKTRHGAQSRHRILVHSSTQTQYQVPTEGAGPVKSQQSFCQVAARGRVSPPPPPPATISTIRGPGGGGGGVCRNGSARMREGAAGPEMRPSRILPHATIAVSGQART